MVLAGIVFGIIFYGVISRIFEALEYAKNAGFRW